MFLKSYFIVLVTIQSLKQCIANNVDVKTSSGLVRGQTLKVLDRNINEFLGIPYAVPPIGSLRFGKSKPIEIPIKDIIDATKTKNSCIQYFMDIWIDFMGNITTDEDCLFLNIWSPVVSNSSNVELKPVMFWIYGGDNTMGSIFQPIYNGSDLAAHDVVYVSVNYRLGPLGFLYGEDMSAYLINYWHSNGENIHMFGGNKDIITIFGESAGSMSVSAHVLSPLTKGLYKRAVLQSGALFYNKRKQVITKNESLTQTIQMAKYFNCSDDKQWLDCLRKINPNKLAQYPNFVSYPIFELEYLPLSAQKAFEQFEFNQDIDLLAGVTQNEGSIRINPNILHKNITKTDFIESVIKLNKTFQNINVENVTKFYLKNMETNNSYALIRALSDVSGDIVLKCPTFLFAKQFTEYSPKSNVFFYELTYKTKNMEKLLNCEPSLSICHGSELEFVFGYPVLSSDKVYTKLDIDLSKQVMQMWTNFAKNGNPGNWPFLLDKKDLSPRVKNFNPNKSIDVFDDPFKENCERFWLDYFI